MKKISSIAISGFLALNILTVSDAFSANPKSNPVQNTPAPYTYSPPNYAAQLQANISSSIGNSIKAGVSPYAIGVSIANSLIKSGYLSTQDAQQIANGFTATYKK